ncbi:MAG: hypothetical protein E3J86_13360 [Candidatus Thorarchaeota archaeon]|nr:MAG: hypothetical protein E3J86_13360 [Candidatus Thorarchaeota archaeon]
MSERNERMGTLVFIVVSASVMIGLYLISFYSYLLFHSIIELFAIIVASAVFVIGWNSREEYSFFRFIGIAYLFIASIDVLHTLSYSGTGIFPGFDANLPTQLWMLARYIEAGSLLVAPFVMKKRVRRRIFVIGYLILFGLLLTTIFAGVFPDAYVVGEGLTLFKIASEFVISGILIIAVYVYHQKRKSFDPMVLKHLYAAIAISIAAEMAFTLYVDPYGLANMIGHYLRFVSYYLIYKAFVESSLIRPFDVMFRNLKASEKSLIAANESLELTNKIVRHDILHELSAVTLTLEIFEQSNKEDYLLTQALESIERCTDLIDCARQMSLIYKGKVEIFPTDVRETLLRVIGGSNLEITIDGDGMVMAGAGLFSVFRNIVLNAETHCKTNRLEITVRSEGDNIETRISDFGSGIAKEIREKIFEEGFTAGESRGSGLGLFIARKVIESYGGKISAEPNEPSGTTFVVSLPRVKKT